MYAAPSFAMRFTMYLVRAKSSKVFMRAKWISKRIRFRDKSFFEFLIRRDAKDSGSLLILASFAIVFGILFIYFFSIFIMFFFSKAQEYIALTLRRRIFAIACASARVTSCLTSHSTSCMEDHILSNRRSDVTPARKRNCSVENIC